MMADKIIAIIGLISLDSSILLKIAPRKTISSRIGTVVQIKIVGKRRLDIVLVISSCSTSDMDSILSMLPTNKDILKLSKTEIKEIVKKSE